VHCRTSLDGSIAMNLLHPPLSEKKTRHQVIIDMDEISKRLDRQAERYRNTHCTKYVCPYCNAFLVPWSWSYDVNQYTCKCNTKKMKGSPTWYQIIEKNAQNMWSFSNGDRWFNPTKIPILFNPSVRQMSEHKFRIGDKVYRKETSQKQIGTVRTLSSGWNPVLVYVRFGNQSFWIDENDLVKSQFNPSVR
jgi:hypothetical protein